MDKKRNLDMFSTMPVYQAVIKNVLPAMSSTIMAMIYNLLLPPQKLGK